MSRLAILVMLFACDPDKGGDDTSDSADTGAPAGLSLAQDDVPREGTLWTDATWTGTISDTTCSGSIAYEERWDDAEPHCTATLTLTGAAYSGDCEGECTGADWAWELSATESDSTGTCTFRQPDNAPGLSGGQYTSVAVHYTAVESDFGYMEEMFALGYFSGQGYGFTYPYLDDGDSPIANGWSPDGTLDLANPVGTGLPMLWRVCEASEFIDVDTAYTADEPMSGAVGQDLSDVWTLGGQSGQTLRAAVDVTGAGTPRLALVDPSGCLVGEAVMDVPCSSGTEDCPSLEYTLPSDGTWSLVVSNLAGDPMDYSLSAAAE